MSRNDFFKKSFPLLVFGLLFTFFSSYGQTFLLSLYVPSIERLLNISNTAFGSLYAAATLSSAFTLPWLGGYFDKMRIRSYALMVVTGFLNTAVFFFQLKLGAARGWSPEWVAGSISAFALAGALGMVGSGPLVDRFSGRRLFPLFVLPYLIGLVVLVFGEHRLAYPLALLLLGLSNGAGSTVKNAMLAEIYGINVIGQVRSVFTTAMVISTGLGPITFGIMLDAGWSFSWIFGAMALIMTLTVANAWRPLVVSKA